jgi:hypothetical protein
VVQELVDNAIRHARTASVLQVSLDSAGLRIAVRDFRTRAEVTPCGGLKLVSRLATSWGVIPRSHGKTIWAQLCDRSMRSHRAVGRDCELSPDATARMLSTEFTSPRPHNTPAKACGR